MAKLTTHVLDVASGRPAAAMKIRLQRRVQDRLETCCEVITSSNGRTAAPLLDDTEFATGFYELSFAVGDYYADQANRDAQRFLTTVVIQFRIDDADANYHVPLLVSPWSYSTYRGS